MNACDDKEKPGEMEAQVPVLVILLDHLKALPEAGFGLRVVQAAVICNWGLFQSLNLVILTTFLLSRNRFSGTVFTFLFEFYDFFNINVI